MFWRPWVPIQKCYTVNGPLNILGDSPGDVGEATEGYRMSCDIGKATEGLQNELRRKGWRMSPAMTITMSSAHSPTFPSLHLRHTSFFNPSVALPTSQLILQLFRCFTYVTVHSPTFLSLLLRHRLFTYVTWRTAHAYLR